MDREQKQWEVVGILDGWVIYFNAEHRNFNVTADNTPPTGVGGYVNLDSLMFARGAQRWQYVDTQGRLK